MATTKINGKLRKAAAAGVALALAACVGAAPAWAYFTDITTANGSLPVSVRPDTHITEEYGDGVKHLVIHNDDTSTVAVFARVGVFASSDFDSMDISGEGWSGPAADGWNGPSGMGWYYYGSADAPTAIDPSGDSSAIDVAFTFPKKASAEDASGATVGDQYNVVVVYETVPATYDQQTGAPAPKWNETFTVNGEGGN